MTSPNVNQFTNHDFKSQAVVAFFDVLGTQAMTSDSGIHDLFRAFSNSMVRAEIPQRVSYSYSPILGAWIFSDNVAVAFDASDDLGEGNYAFAMRSLADFYVEMLSRGYLLRGGIGFGSLCYNSHMCLGTALSNAYRAESNHAANGSATPGGGIAIDESAHHFFEELKRPYAPGNDLIESELIRGKDEGRVEPDTVNVFKFFLDATVDEYEEETEFALKRIELIEKAISHMNSQINSLTNRRAKAKWVWTAERLAETLRKFYPILERKSPAIAKFLSEH